MGRVKDPNTKYRMKLFVSNNHRYAVTSDPGYNQDRKWVSNITTWGNLSETCVFSPNVRFVLLPQEEKSKFIFPPEWDISAAYAAMSVPDEGGDLYSGEDKYRIYGDSLLLDEIATSCFLKEDLTSVFGEETTKELLTISYFYLETGKNLCRLEAEAKVQWFPAENGLSPERITRLSQSITKEQIDTFMSLRRQRYEGNGRWFGVDSSSISNYSKHLSDAKWGKNKEHDPLKQLNILVMYDMVSELPAHYRNLPGNMPDSRTLRLLFEELKSAGFNEFGLVLDRAYLTKENLDLFVLNGYKGIFMAKTSDSAVKNEIIRLSSRETSIKRTGVFLPEFDCYAKECIYPYSYKETAGKGRGTELDQRLCLFFDPELQGAEDKELSKEIIECTKSLDEYLKQAIPVDEKILKRLKKYFDLTVDENSVITSYSLNRNRVDEKSERNGYFAVVCVNMDKKDFDASWILSTYHKRDLQEKAFMYMKNWQNGRRLRTSTEPSTEGRRFFQFVTLIINCQLHHLYFRTSEAFQKVIPTPWQMLDEMRSVRYVQLKGRKTKVSEFVGKQVDIFDELGFEVPKGCRPTSKKKPKTKKN